MSDAGDKWSKAERLAVAGAIAPILREQRSATRRVARVNEAGEVVGYTTVAEVQRALLRERAIEMDVTDGARPLETPCELCGKPIPVAARGGRRSTCKGGCKRQRVCPGFGAHEGECDAVPGPYAFQKKAVIARDGRPWMCMRCAVIRTSALSSERAADPRNRDRMVDRARAASETQKSRCESRRAADAAAGRKTCTSCRESRAFQEFSKAAAHRDGLAYACKACMRARRQNGRAA